MRKTKRDREKLDISIEDVAEKVFKKHTDIKNIFIYAFKEGYKYRDSILDEVIIEKSKKQETIQLSQQKEIQLILDYIKNFRSTRYNDVLYDSLISFLELRSVSDPIKIIKFLGTIGKVEQSRMGFIRIVEQKSNLNDDMSMILKYIKEKQAKSRHSWVSLMDINQYSKQIKISGITSLLNHLKRQNKLIVPKQGYIRKV